MKNKIVTREEWLAERKILLKKEKEFTKLRDQLTQEIRDMPWVKIKEDYLLESSLGEEKFSELFRGKSQLIVYHFMFDPTWKQGCKSCSFWADNFDKIIIHLHQRDVNMIAISRAPIKKLLNFKKRMGWTFKMVSSYHSDFNYDYNVSIKEGESTEYNYKEVPAGKARELPGISVFYKDEDGNIYHTYSRFSRGLDLFNTTYNYLDIVPKGRDEKDLPYSMAWVKLHDQYEEYRP